MTYEDMADWLDENIFPSDYGSLEDYAKVISNEFGINMELAMALARPFWEEYLEERFQQESLDDFEPEQKSQSLNQKKSQKKLN